MFLRPIFIFLLFALSLRAGETDPSTSTPSPSSSATTLLPIAPLPQPQAPVAPIHSSAEPVENVSLPEGAAPEKSVVQITNSYVEPNWTLPWQLSPLHTASGTGFLIAGNRIMTNAHVVAWTTRLLVRKYHDPHEYQAHIEYVGHDIDLAVLKVDEPSFYNGMQPLVFGDLPKVRSTVITYGFPAGGQQISYTRGVVSRIEVQKYVHIGNRAFLACQTDAAINPGNSGGPVIQDDKVVGVAFEGLTELSNTSYFIPTTMVNHFLDDIADSTYDGVPDSGLHLVALQNPSFRRRLQLPPESTRGVRVDSILNISSTRDLIKPDDVILQVGDFPVDEDSTITYQNNTVGVSVAFDLAQNGQSIPLKLWRDGREIDVALPMKVYHDDYAAGNQYDVKPPYFVYGGLVFTTLSLDYLKEQSDGSSDSGRDLIYQLFYQHSEDPEHWRAEPVVLSSILNHPVNADFQIRGRAMINKINGRRIEKLSDVIQALSEAKTPLSTIEFAPDNHLEVIDSSEAQKVTPGLLQDYNISADRQP